MKTIALHLLIIALLGLAACSGGGGGSDTPPLPTPPLPPTSGITGTGIAVGPISNFGSIIVNGVKYETDSATFTINGEPGSQSDLSVGQIVTVVGDVNDDLISGQATSVTFDDDVKGPVQSIDSAGSVIVVLGQTVQISNTTSFDDSIPGGELSGLSVGDNVEVSGFVDANGDILASRIELKTNVTQFEVTGLVSSHDAAARTFTINQLTVDYSAATLEDFPGGEISDGQRVEVEGAPPLGANGELVASEVELKGADPLGVDGDRIEIEGFISRFSDATDFDVAGIPVVTDASTVFEDGQASDLGLNVKVEVEGLFNDQGQIVADKVEIERDDPVSVEALIDAVDAEQGTLTVLGIEVTVDAQTRLEDNSDAELSPLTLMDLNVGDYVEIEGSEIPAGSGTILAAGVEREDIDEDTELQGFVTDFMDPTITVLGVTIETGTAEFRDENDMSLSQAEFFSRLEVNSLIKVKGVETSSTVIVADEVEFETED